MKLPDELDTTLIQIAPAAELPCGTIEGCKRNAPRHPESFKIDPPDYSSESSIEDLTEHWLDIVERLRAMFPRLSYEDLQDVVQTAFLKLAKEGVGCLGRPCLASFLRLVYRTAIDLIRKRSRQKWGGRALHVTWDTDWEFQSQSAEYPQQCESPFERVEIARTLLRAVRPKLSSREFVCLRLLEEALPFSPTSSDSFRNTTDDERNLFEPKDPERSSHLTYEELIRRELRRSFDNLYRKIRVVAEEMDLI